MDRSQKAESVAALNATFNEVGVVVVTRNLGMSVAQSTALRVKMRDAGASYKVSKNRLAKLAIANTNYAGSMTCSPVRWRWRLRSIRLPRQRSLSNSPRPTDKLEIVGGAMGRMVLNAEGIKALASMPSLDELRAKLIGLVQAPATKIAQLATAPAAKLARVFGAYAAKEAA